MSSPLSLSEFDQIKNRIHYPAPTDVIRLAGALESVLRHADKLDTFGANARGMNPSSNPRWEGKAKDYERQARQIRRAIEDGLKEQS